MTFVEQPSGGRVYVLRFFFGYGGTCLWAANDAARERFGYAVELSDLPVSDELRAALHAACARFDTSLNWDDPAGPSPWPEEDWMEFNRASDEVLAQLRESLGALFEVRDERGDRTAR